MPACGWEVLGCDTCAAFVSMETEMQDEIEAWAIDRMWQWTFERFGLCEITITSEDCGWCCLLDHTPTGCGCRDLTAIKLPGPIAEPLEILINGIELDLDAVQVENHNWLVRIDGQSFPRRDWEITYMRGEPIPPGAGIVTGILAAEYAKRVCNDDSCRLPKRLTVTNRQGMTIAAIDNFEGLQDGFTGIWEIDDWIATQNKRRWEARVTSPDIPQPIQVTWSYASS